MVSFFNPVIDDFVDQNGIALGNSPQARRYPANRSAVLDFTGGASKNDLFAARPVDTPLPET